MKAKVLVIEDDQDISFGIRTVLARSGFDVASSTDGKEGLRAFHVSRPDLIVLDIGLPALDGWAVLERIRDMSDLPVPFGNGELAARVEALLRRPRTGQQEDEVYDDGSLLVRHGSREVSVDGASIALTPTEYRLLTALIRHPGQPLTPDQLLKLAWNDPLGIGPERVEFGIMRLLRQL